MLVQCLVRGYWLIISTQSHEYEAKGVPCQAFHNTANCYAINTRQFRMVPAVENWKQYFRWLQSYKFYFDIPANQQWAQTRISCVMFHLHWKSENLLSPNSLILLIKSPGRRWNPSTKNKTTALCKANYTANSMLKSDWLEEIHFNNRSSDICAAVNGRF